MPTIDDFINLDIRVGRVLEAAPLEGARKPAYRLRIDFGPDLGERDSSAQITDLYGPADLVGRLVLGIVNLPPRRIAGLASQVLTLGVYSSGDQGKVVLIAPDAPRPDGSRAPQPGDKLG